MSKVGNLLGINYLDAHTMLRAGAYRVYAQSNYNIGLVMHLLNHYSEVMALAYSGLDQASIIFLMIDTKTRVCARFHPRQAPSQRSTFNSNRIMDAKNRLTTPTARFGINSRQNCFFSRSASLSHSSSGLACSSLTALLRRSMSAGNCCLTPPRLTG